MRGVSIYSWFGFPLPMEERFKLIKEAGFDATFISWDDEYADVDVPKEEHPEIARKNGLYVENAHLSFSSINELWIDGLQGESLIKSFLYNIEQCAEHNIPTAILHLTSGNTPPPCNQIGLDRIKRLVEVAEKKGVNIALENLRRPEYLDFAFSNIQSGRLGFCYDSGHENCYTRDTDMLARYGSKLMALHLHDNDGTQDQHQIPGEGTIGWSVVSQKLTATGYTGAIGLEVTNEFSQYRGRETAIEFLRRAYEAANTLCRGCIQTLVFDHELHCNGRGAAC